MNRITGNVLTTNIGILKEYVATKKSQVTDTWVDTLHPKYYAILAFKFCPKKIAILAR